MKPTSTEIERRTAMAFAAIKNALNGGEDASCVRLFVTHHLQELNAEYWQGLVGRSQPSPDEVVELLQLFSHWGEDNEDGIEVFDFSLPHDATQYFLSVRFSDDGNVEEISLES